MRWKLYLVLILVIFISSFIQAETHAAGVFVCVDSDNGIKRAEFGNITYSYISVPGPGDYFYVWDECIDANDNPVSSCEGEGCRIKEFWCSYNVDVDDYDVEYDSTSSCINLGYTGCTDGICTGAAPTCSDGEKNGDETDVDCGGPDCSPCDEGEECIVSSDCESSICENGLCVEPGTECNPYFDTAYNEYRGCYPNDIYADPNCPCPEPNETESCNPYFDTGYNEYRGCYPNDPSAPIDCPCPETPDTCTNGIWDTGEGEEGIDCGGPDCPPCAEPIPECVYVDPENSCEMDSTRCNFEEGLIEVCLSTGWQTVFGSEGQYVALGCEDKECNQGWFICDVEAKTIAFCDEQGLWGEFENQKYNEFCTPIIIDETNVKNILGETYNNTIVRYMFVSGETSESLLNKVPWWIWLILGVLVVYAGYFSYKYYKCIGKKK